MGGKTPAPKWAEMLARSPAEILVFTPVPTPEQKRNGVRPSFFDIMEENLVTSKKGLPVNDGNELIRLEKVPSGMVRSPSAEDELSVAQGDFVAILGPNGRKDHPGQSSSSAPAAGEGPVWILHGEAPGSEQFAAWPRSLRPPKATSIDLWFPASTERSRAMAFLRAGSAARGKGRDRAVELALKQVGMTAFRNADRKPFRRAASNASSSPGDRERSPASLLDEPRPASTPPPRSSSMKCSIR